MKPCKIYIKNTDYLPLHEAVVKDKEKGISLQETFNKLTQIAVTLKPEAKTPFNHNDYESLFFRIKDEDHEILKALSKKTHYSISELYLMAFNKLNESTKQKEN